MPGFNPRRRLSRLAMSIDHGAQVNLIPAGFDFAFTPPHYAALGGHRDMVDRLFATVRTPTRETPRSANSRRIGPTMAATKN